MATSLEHIDFTTIPDTHKGDLRNGWYRHPSGLYLSPLAIAKHRMAGHPPTQFTYDRWRHGGWYVHETMWPNGGCGCVSRNYTDRKWRIACDPGHSNSSRHSPPATLPRAANGSSSRRWCSTPTGEPLLK